MQKATTLSKVEQKIQELKDMGKVIPGIEDSIFKRIMLDHKDYLVKILNELILFDEKITEEDITFIKNEFPPHHYQNHLSRTDLLIKVKNYYIQIEANSRLDDLLLLRNDTHFDSLCLDVDANKDKHIKDEKITQINFNKKVETNLIQKLKDNCVAIMQYADKEKEVLYPKYTKIHVNIENISNKWYTNSELSWFEKATKLLITEDIKEIEELVRGDDILERVGESIKAYSSIKEVVNERLYAYIEETYQHNRLKFALEQGLEKGLQQGARNKQIDIVKNLLAINMEIKDISKVTGLSIKEIKSLQENKN